MLSFLAGFLLRGWLAVLYLRKIGHLPKKESRVKRAKTEAKRKASHKVSSEKTLYKEASKR